MEARLVHDLDRSRSVRSRSLGRRPRRMVVRGALSLCRFERDRHQRDWKWDVSRSERSVGRRVTLSAGVMASYSTTSEVGTTEPRDNLTAVRHWWEF